jgi:hypothetical protein
MKKILLLFCIPAFAILAGCQKETKPTQAGSLTKTTEKKGAKTSSLLTCQPVAYLLSVNPIGSISSLYQVTGTPNSLPITATPINGSAGTNRLQNCLGTAVTHVFGLAYDPGTGIFYGVQVLSGSTNIIQFTDPSCVSVIPATTSCGIGLNLRDIERDPASGNYYALDDGMVVLVDVNTGVVTCLPNYAAGAELKGLTFDCSGQLYVLGVSLNAGTLHAVDKTTGLITASYPSFYMVHPNGNIDWSRDAGLHYDCTCINAFITGHQNSGIHINYPIKYVDYLPAALGGLIYDSLTIALPRTVDFARP